MLKNRDSRTERKNKDSRAEASDVVRSCATETFLKTVLRALDDIMMVGPRAGVTVFGGDDGKDGSRTNGESVERKHLKECEERESGRSL
jgi:hypothetical protein